MNKRSRFYALVNRGDAAGEILIFNIGEPDTSHKFSQRPLIGKMSNGNRQIRIRGSRSAQYTAEKRQDASKIKVKNGTKTGNDGCRKFQNDESPSRVQDPEDLSQSFFDVGQVSETE